MGSPRCFAIFLFIFVNNFSHNYCFGINFTQNFSQDSGTVVSENSEGVSETQYATCRITTEELVANAQATVTRVLTGVCDADTVDAHFRNLERLIMREFNDIKERLNSIASKKSSHENLQFVVDPRQEEIDRLNNTVNTVNTVAGVEKTFSYFMRVKDFNEKASRWDSGWFERSETFYLPVSTTSISSTSGRYAMYLKVTPRDIRGEITYVNIGVVLTRGIYDETLQWPFSLKHQVEILDHSVQGFRRDLRSSIVNPLTSGSPDNWIKPSNFGKGENREHICIAIPGNFIITDNHPRSNSNLNQNIAKYLWDGDLIVKLVIFL